MAHLNQTLLQYLKNKNPVINSSACKRGSNTTSVTAAWLIPQAIEEWKDFDYESLKSIYGGMLHEALERQYTLQDFSDIAQYPFCHIHDERSLEAFLGRWTQPLVEHALCEAQDRLEGVVTRERIHMVGGGLAEHPGYGSKFRPDWAGVQLSTTRFSKNKNTPRNILPGDTKVSKKWTSRKIKSGTVRKEYSRANWMRPLSQINTYCVRGNARYGYLVTDEELVVVRVRPMAPTNPQTNPGARNSVALGKAKPAARAAESGILEYKAVPWKNHTDDNRKDQDALTVNLALWWLHMMAAESSSIEDLYLPLCDVACATLYDGPGARLAFSERPSKGNIIFGAGPKNRNEPVMAGLKGKKRVRDDDGQRDVQQSNRQRRKTRTEN